MEYIALETILKLLSKISIHEFFIFAKFIQNTFTNPDNFFLGPFDISN